MALLSTELRNLIATPELPDLGPGPRAGILAIREIDAPAEEMSLPVPRIQLIRATLYLWHDHLQESHSIAQGIDNANGNYLHGIMHRREPDYGNASYWFHRVGKHPSFPELARRAKKLCSAAPDSAAKLPKPLFDLEEWNPFAFIEACERVSLTQSAPELNLLREIQAAEIETLLEYFSERP